MKVSKKTSLETPMVRQYLRIKSQYQDAILFFHMGDFYEMFFEDAKVASRVLNIALTSRNKEKPDAIPLCGIPCHSAENYISRLVKDGYNVAVCDQIGDIQKGSKLVRREVVRVITPGTILTEGYLNDKKNNFMAAVNQSEDSTGLAFLDISTGDFIALELSGHDREEIISRLSDFEPSEVILPEKVLDPATELFDSTDAFKPNVIRLENYHFDSQKACQTLMNHFGTTTLEPFGITEHTTTLPGAAGAVLHYALETQKHPLGHIRKLNVISHTSNLQMDASTRRNLELVRSAAHGGREGTLLGLIDETLTPMGGRLLRQWIVRPLTDLDAIQKRLDGVSELVENIDISEGLRKNLKSVLDLERLMSRISLGFAGPRDFLALMNSVAPLGVIRQLISSLSSPIFQEAIEKFDPLEDVFGHIEESIREDAPATTKDGGFIKTGYDSSLDAWLLAKHQGRSWITDLEKRERERTGINSLKIRYNRVFGYFIEITKSHLKDVPENYIRKQTLVGSERFTSAELSGYETKILEADEKSLQRELELFQKLREDILACGERIKFTCQILSSLDIFQSFSKTALKNNYCCPALDISDTIDIRDGRHPVVEAVSREEPFIPNDCFLDLGEHQILIITGPNMAGKSTYLRQIALTVLMAQMGSFVPCSKARIGIVDRIFTRVGATDYLARGQSTFMVEMTETAMILNNATPKSLVILDEIGRGTSTFDGLSIAWAVAEYIHDNPATKARTLFATHYHQLSELSLTLPGAKNYSTSVKEWGDRIVFLRKIVEGSSDKSYGIQVARLAGLPASVILRAKEIMANLEEGELDCSGMPRLADHHQDMTPPPSQLYLFSRRSEEILDRLGAVNIENLTPIEALNVLAELVERANQRKT